MSGGSPQKSGIWVMPPSYSNDSLEKWLFRRLEMNLAREKKQLEKKKGREKKEKRNNQKSEIRRMSYIRHQSNVLRMMFTKLRE